MVSADDDRCRHLTTYDTGMSIWTSKSSLGHRNDVRARPSGDVHDQRNGGGVGLDRDLY